MAGRSTNRSIGWPRTDLSDRNMDESIVRLNDGLLGYAIDRVIKTVTRLGGMYGNVKFLNRGEVRFL